MSNALCPKVRYLSRDVAERHLPRPPHRNGVPVSVPKRRRPRAYLHADCGWHITNRPKKR
jgi:hypothetical protein